MAQRTQSQRSAAMRRRLLEATVDCLVEYGYPGTTTTAVAARAGVTRGAQVHHFHTRTDLVAAAISYLAARQVELAFGLVDQVCEAQDRLGAALDLMWRLHQGPVFHAIMELWVAARTDPELRAQLTLVEPATTASLVELSNISFGEYAHSAAFRHCLFTAMDVVRGILVSPVVQADNGQLDARWQRAKADLRVMFEARCGIARPAG